MFKLFSNKSESRMPKLSRLSDSLSVTGQIQPNAVADLAKEGFRTIICNRPDGESPGQPTAREIYDAAIDAGISFAYIPVSGGRITQQDVDSFAKAVKSANGPVLAYCRSGNRSQTLARAAGC